jgi:uncharacterized protein YjbI with pentapeptide repeats
MTDIDRWVLSYQGRVVNIWYNQDYTVYGVNPGTGGQPPGDNNIVTLVGLGNQVIGLRCNANSGSGGRSCYASVRDDYSYQVQFQAPGGGWITNPGKDEYLRVVPTGDGYFALFSTTWGMYVTVDPGPNPKAGNCNPLRATTGDMNRAARFTAATLNQARDLVADLLDASNSAAGLSFAGMNLANRTLRGDLSLCDFRGAASLKGCVMDGANLKKASFAGQHLAGLSISNADCTGTDFTRCDFSSFVPGTPPPMLASAILTRAVVPAGNSWSGAKMPGAVLAGANLTGCDLSGPPTASTDLTGAILGGAGGTQFTPFFTPAYQGGGIGGYDMRSPTDRVIAYGDGHGKPNYLVCYRPGRGVAGVVYPQGAAFGHVLLNGDPGGGGMGAGLGGYTLADPADQIIAYDGDGQGKPNYLVCYRPGKGVFSIIEKKTDVNNNVTFGTVYDSANGIIGDCDLSDPADRIIAYDFLGTGRLDHLVCYRPGTGKLWIVEKNVDANHNVTFSTVYKSTSGIGHYDLGSKADRLIAYDYESSGRPDYLLCYRPGTGAMTIAHRQGDTFANVYMQGDPGNGIGDPKLRSFSLLDPLDQIIAYDHTGTGHLDHLVCYRPGAGLIMILKKVSDKDDPSAFAPVYWQRFGIGDYDLASPADQVIAYDYAATGHLDHLVCYRPGSGTIWVIQPKGPQATLDRCNLGKANLSGASLAGADLTTTATLAGANLSDTQLNGTNLSGTHLEGAILSGTQLEGAKLDGANLSGATLFGTNFTGLDLTKVTFSAPLKRSTDLSNPTIFTGCTLPYAVIGLDWSNLDLTSATINGLPTNLTGLVAVGVHWNDGYFVRYVLDGANFAHAVLERAHFTGAKLRDKASFASATMTGAHFTSAVLDQADFTGALLGGVAVNQSADFTFAFISNCTFTGANLYGVDFASATLVSGNKLTGTADLEEANFADAYLPGADFTGARLGGAKFDGAFMVQVTLTEADLSPSQHGAIAASLTSASMQAAVFQGTKLYGANLADAVITNTAGSIVEQHYGEDGTLTAPSTMHYRPGRFPDAASFGDETTCPNRETYTINKQQGLDIPRMMQTPNPPPTKWTPKQTMPEIGAPPSGS